MEKKKRWRPSLTAYRELQREIDEQIEAKSVLVADCDAWREKYHELAEKEEKTSRYLQKILQSDVSCSTYESVLNERDEYRRMYEELRGRGFWARVLNKGV